MNSPIYAGGFIFDPSSRSILLHLRDNNTIHNPNKWSVLGGLTKTNESPLDCFRREIREEVGIILEQTECKLILEYLHPEQKTKSFIYYAERDSSGTRIALTEGSRVKWVPLVTAMEYDLTHWTRQALSRILGREIGR